MTERHSVWREYLEALLVAGLFLGFTNTFVLKTFYIPSASMEETLLVGDHLIVNRFIYGPSDSPLGAILPNRQPKRGDIVVFRSPEKPELDLVKRCIGEPGDSIQMIEKQLFVNGEAVKDSEFAIHRDPRIGTRRERDFNRRQRDNFGPVKVPEGEYFFLGDNRDESYDSRYWGTVPEHYIKGRAFLIYWSYGGETPDGSWHGWGEKIGQLGKTVIGFVPKSRWSRSFRLIR
ncbi:MAG: signal peptidase I [Thermoanaerobaculia bacterium]|nr:signal peptidase I [Thermoanaerobaculia bacterium]